MDKLHWLNIITDSHSARNKGSALLIALMIMASLGVATLSAAKLFLSETKTSTNISETAGAYYAAEGALEKALLKYKENPAIQLSGDCVTGVGVANCLPTVNSPWHLESGLQNGALLYTKIYNTSDMLENNNDIVRDESREFTIYGGDSVTLKWRWSEPSQPNQGIRIIYINPETLAVDENKTAADIFINSQTSYTFATASSPNTIIKVRAMGNSIDWYKLASDGGKVDTGITTIDIKSKYLDVSRQLQVKINRNENQGSALNSLFDYTLLSDCSLDGNGLDSNRNCASAL